MTSAILSRIACAAMAFALTTLSIAEATTVNPINFHGEGTERPALYA